MKTSFSRLLTCIVSILIIVITISPIHKPMPATAASLAAATISINPSSGIPGTVITINASGFLTGANGEVRWDGATRETFFIESSTFTKTLAVPVDATGGNHVVTVCGNCYGEEFVDMVNSNFNVTIPPTNTPRPTNTFTIPPPLIPTHTSTPMPAKGPDACTSLGLGTDAVVINFDDFSPGTLLNDQMESAYGIVFDNTLEIGIPTVSVHSGTNGGLSRLVGDFGSIDQPVVMRFDRGLSAVGTFIGLENMSLPTDAVEDTVTATLSAFGYRSGSTEVIFLGSDSFTFPAIPTPIQYCVKIIAGEGEIITNASLEYSNIDGQSLIDRRVMDDLTLVYSDLSLPEDLPPTVTITSPADGTVISEDEVQFNAEIREDRSLDSVTYRIENDRPAGAFFEGNLVPSPVSDDPFRYLITKRIHSDDYFSPGESYFLIVKATDSSGQTGQDRIRISYAPPSTLDIRITNIEITQAIQCMNNPECGSNTVTLFQRKPTLVRLYLSTNTGSVTGVTGKLFLLRDDESEIYSTSSINEAIVDDVADPVGTYRSDITHTLNFRLPPEAISQPGLFRLKVVINPTHEPEECCYDNNEKTYSGLEISRSESLHIIFIPIYTRGHRGNLEEGWKIIDWLSRIYPIYDIRFWRYRSGSPVEMEGDSVSDFGCGPFWTDILNELWWLNFWTDDPEDYMRYYGLVDPASLPIPNIVGCGKRPGDEAAGRVETGDRQTGQTAAEEIGHNHGRMHATACNGARNPDSGYPMVDGLLDEFGIDVLDLIIYPPSSSYDVMGYCGSETTEWISRYTYLALADAIGSVAQNDRNHYAGLTMPVNSEQPDIEYLVASGEVNPDKAIIYDGFYRLLLPLGTKDDLPDGDYSVELVDANNSILSIRKFGPMIADASFMRVVESSPVQEVNGAFQLVLPWVDGTTAVIFRYNGTEIARRQVSSENPVVNLTSPNGGENWGASEKASVKWVSSDLDGDKLTHSIQYSPDGGETWVSLASNVQGNEIDVDTANIMGSENMLVRVFVSDGMNTSSDISNGTFRVASKPPDVFIASPADQTTYQQGQPVFFQAFATDIEDGPVTDGSVFSWNSNRDGTIGIGNQLLLENLSPGKHKITLSVRDNSGMVGSQIIIIYIEPQSGPSLSQLRLIRMGLIALYTAGFILLLILILKIIKKPKHG